MKADNRPPQKTAGYLEKRGKLKFMNSWKRYWFVLEGHLLLYYGSKDDYDGLSPCKGSFSLGHTSTVKPYSPVPLGFQINIRSTTITLRAESAAEQTKWMQAFVNALNPNQSTNESPTKLNHFRYSAENLTMLTENREDFHGTPNSSPHGESPLDTPKARESPLIDRLQKMGARSYGAKTSVQNQILEGVRNSRQRSFAKETVAEYNQKEEMEERGNNETRKLQLSPTNVFPRTSGKMLHDNKDSEMKKDSVILEDEDFCVCTLGKEDNDELETAKKEVKIESNSFPLKPNVLTQELNSEFNRRRKIDSKISVLPTFSESNDKIVDIHINDFSSEEPIKSSYTKQKNLLKRNSIEESDKELADNNNEIMKQHKESMTTPNSGIYENVGVKKEFYLHGEVSPESIFKNTEKPKVIHPKPVRKMKNIRNLLLESQDNSSFTRNVGDKEEQSFRDIYTEPNEKNNIHITEQKRHNEHVKTKNPSFEEPHKEIAFNRCDTSTHINAESHKERPFKNNSTSKRVLENDPALNVLNNNHSTSNENLRGKSYFNKASQSKTDDEFHLIPDTKHETLSEKSNEVVAPAYAKVNKEGNFKNKLDTQAEPDDVHTKSSINIDHLKTKAELNNTFKNHSLKPSNSKTDLELHLHSGFKNDTSVESESDNSLPVYAKVNKQRNLKHNLNSQANPEDDRLTNIANNNEIVSKSTSYNVISSADQSRDKCHFTKPLPLKTDLRFNVHIEPKNETFHAEINKEQKLKHKKRVNNLPTSDEKNTCKGLSHHLTPNDNPGTSMLTHFQSDQDRKLKNTVNKNIEPKEELITRGNGNHAESNITITTPHLLNIRDKPNNELMDMHLVKPKGEKTGTGTPTRNNEIQNPNIFENIYAEPDDINTTSPKLVIKSHPVITSNRPLLAQFTDKTTAIYTEPINQKDSKNMRNSDSEYHMIDNVLYAAPNNDYNNANLPEQNWFFGNKESLRTEELQCQMDFDEEPTEEFECDNDLYGSPDTFLNKQADLCATSADKGQIVPLQKTWKRQFQFPPPPTDDVPIYAEPILPVEKNVRGLHVKSNDLNDKFDIQKAECEMENELYAASNVGKNNYEYPEYEEPEIISHSSDYNANIGEANANKNSEEVEYSCIPDIDGKTDQYYSRPFRTNDDFHLYEDPEMCQVDANQEKGEPVKTKNKNRRQRSEPCPKIDRTEESKKGDHFIQKIFKQAVRKNIEKSDKCGEPSLIGNRDQTLIMLTEIQELLEKKKRMIKAMALQGRGAEVQKTHFKSKSADLDNKCRSKSYPSRSPDLLKDINDRVMRFRGLEDDYATVCDVMKEGDEIYCEVVGNKNFKGKNTHPTGFGKFDTWSHGKISDND